MKDRAPTAAPQTAAPMLARPSRGLLQRKCACGGAPGPTGECAECRRKRRPGDASAPATGSTMPPTGGQHP